MDTTEMKDQMQYIWSRLDDLSINDPIAYKKFIAQKLEERKILSSSPEPKLCIQTKTLGKGKEQDVFINVFGWMRIPYPEQYNEPVKLMAGCEETSKNKRGRTEVRIPVALNDKLLNTCLGTGDINHIFMKMIMDLVEDQKKIKLSETYTKYKEIYRGNFPAQPIQLFIKKPQFPDLEEMKKMMENEAVNSPEDLLKKLSMNDEKKTDGATGKDKVDYKKAVDSLLGPKTDSKTKKNRKLIEEVKQDDQTLPIPDHTCTQMPEDAKGSSRFVESMELLVEEKYNLVFKFPSIISEDDSRAKFNKKTSYLTITLPLK